MMPVFAEINLISLSPAPNYQLYNKNDYSVLVDGKLNDFPMWTKKESIGWRAAYRIAIELDIGNYKNIVKLGNPVEVSIHVPKGLYAGVKIPHRIDVYGGVDIGKYKHLAYLNLDGEGYADREHHWIKLQVPYIGRSMAIVIQSPGNSIFIDEISIRKLQQKQAPVIIDSSSVVGIDAVIRDAGFRVQEFYLNASNKKFEGTHRVKNRNPLLWECDVFDELTGDIPKQVVVGNPISLNIDIHPFNRHICFGFYSGGPKNELLEVSLEVDKGARLYSLKNVVAENAEVVPDAAIPIEISKSIEVRANSVNYFVLDFTKGEHGTVWLTYGDWTATVVVDSIGGTILSKSEVVEPLAFAWSYSHNLPVWNNKVDALNSLLTAGINVFTIHYYNTPIMPNRRRKDSGSTDRFKDDIRRYAGKGLMLVLSEVYSYYRQAQEADVPLAAISQLKVDYIKWLDFIVEGFEDEGVGYREWALYLVDEINPEKYAAYSDLIDWTIEHNENIQLYSNPSTTQRNYRALAELLEDNMRDIDIWQPRLEFAEKYHRLFERTQKRWMTYHNPTYPAKAANPLLHYRLPAIRSWLIGADGTGVWSFDDSGRSNSTWNDFGGKSAGYSTVYEYKHTVVPSRRWLAFAAGLNDIKYLLSLEKLGCDREKMIRMLSPVVRSKSTNTRAISLALLGVATNCMRDIHIGG